MEITPIVFTDYTMPKNYIKKNRTNISLQGLMGTDCAYFEYY